MGLLDVVAALAAGYFLGGIPNAALVARLWQRDIFRLGSGNMGAMNAARNLNPLAGVLVLAADVAKGAGAALLGGGMADLAGVGAREAMTLAAGVGAVAGHAWSPYVRFRGGKALATALGAALPAYPLAAAYAVLLLVALTLLSRRATAAALATLAAYPLLTALTLERAGWERERVFATVTAVACIAAISAARHLWPSKPRS